MRAGVDWSAVAARECFDGACGEDLPGPFAELGRRARGEVRYPERDLWASVREDAAWPGASSKGACGGSCGCAGGGDGLAEVDDFWAPVVEGARSASKPEPRASASRSVGRGLAKRCGVSRPPLPLPGRRAGAPSHGKTSPVPEDGSLDTTVDAEVDTPTSGCYDADGHRVDCCSWFCDSGPCLDAASEDCLSLPYRIDESDELLAPPAEKDWGECGDKLKGDTDTCSAKIDSQTLGDFWAIDPDAYMDTLKVVDAEDTEEELIRYAWALLNENTDLIKYAVCWVTGNVRWFDGDQLVNVLRGGSGGSGWRVTVRMTDCDTDGARVVLRSIYICRTGENWNRMLDVFETSQRKLVPCAVMEAALMLLHELTHIVGRAIADAWDWLGTCRTSYLITNVFRWAMYQRYAWLGTDEKWIPCCFGLGNASYFGSALAPPIKGGCT